MNSAARRHRLFRFPAARPGYLALCLMGALFWWSGPGANDVRAASAQGAPDQESSGFTTDPQSIFIGRDPDTGDDVVRVTPPRQPEQQQPQMPYILPEVTVPWPPRDRPNMPYPPDGGSGNGGGLYPPYAPDRPHGPGYPAHPGRPDQPGWPGHPDRPDRPGQPPHSGLEPPGAHPGFPPGGPYPPAHRPDHPSRPDHWNGGSGRWHRQPGSHRPQGLSGGGAFVYRPGRELPRFPTGNRPYAPLGPSGPVILPRSGR